MLNLYRILTLSAAGPLCLLLKYRLARGKEDPVRIGERKGMTKKTRPQGALIWLHAASIGESQSSLILIDRLLKYNKYLNILVTTGTLTSSQLMAKNLPKQAFHQFYPLDHPKWVEQFIDHWTPNYVLWMESELWPNMLQSLKARNIPAALINARLSDSSFKRWKIIKRYAGDLLSAFNLILTQTDKDRLNFKVLGAKTVVTTDNLKYSATALHANKNELNKLSNCLKKRPLWLYASTHKGEEAIAARIHSALQRECPELLTIIVPRHPERRHDIIQSLKRFTLTIKLRGDSKAMPDDDTDIYIADTLGELGLFYSLAPIACIGRSLSDDGGGGHNPIEAAQLQCAVLHGPHVQYQQEIFDEMNNAGAAQRVENEIELLNALQTLLSNPQQLKIQQKMGAKFAHDKNNVINRVMTQLSPHLSNAGLAQ